MIIIVDAANELGTADDLPLQISLYQYKRLNRLHITAILTRASSIAFSNQAKSLLINNYGVGEETVVISNKICDTPGLKIICSPKINNFIIKKVKSFLLLEAVNIPFTIYSDLNDNSIFSTYKYSDAYIVSYGCNDSSNSKYYLSLGEIIIKAICSAYNLSYE